MVGRGRHEGYCTETQRGPLSTSPPIPVVLKPLQGKNKSYTHTHTQTQGSLPSHRDPQMPRHLSALLCEGAAGHPTRAARHRAPPHLRSGWAPRADSQLVQVRSSPPSSALCALCEESENNWGAQGQISNQLQLGDLARPGLGMRGVLPCTHGACWNMRRAEGSSPCSHPYRSLYHMAEARRDAPPEPPNSDGTGDQESMTPMRRKRAPLSNSPEGGQKKFSFCLFFITTPGGVCSDRQQSPLISTALQRSWRRHIPRKLCNADSRVCM